MTIDPVITPEIFAQSLVEDYNLAPSYHGVIVRSIQDQLSDFQAHAVNFDVAVDVEEGYTDYDSPHHADRHTAFTDNENDRGEKKDQKEKEQERERKKAILRGVLDDNEEQWWATWRRKVKKEAKRAVREAALLRGKKRRKEGDASVGASVRKRVGKRRRRLVQLADGHREHGVDGDVDMFADNEQDEKENNAIAEDGSGEEEDEEWKVLGVDEIKVDEQIMHEEMRILIKVRFT